MKIGIDARFYGPRVGGGGLGRYVTELVNHLQLIDTDHEYVLFLRKENFHECKIVNPRFSKRLVDIPWYTVEEQRRLPGYVRLARVDVMHYPHWNIPIFSRVPFIVTIHDLILLQDRTSARSSTRHPFVHGLKYAGFRTVLENAVHRSKHIISVSQFTKDSILNHFGIHPVKITVVPNGVIPQRESRSVSLTALGVYQPYFLYVGNAYPHKNLEMMMHAFAQFHPAHRHVQLVIAGRRDVFSRKLEKEAAELNLAPGAVRFVDLPTDDELAALYKNAALFIFPSRIEGFGIPPLEALSYGTPVAASESASLPEVLREGARYFDPNDIEMLTQYMNDAINAPHRFDASIQAGQAQVERFTWMKTAKQTLNVYNELSLL